MSKASEVVRQFFTRGGIVGLLAVIVSAGSLCAFGVSEAGAVVNDNGLNRAYTITGTGCQAVVGDQYSPYNEAIAEIDVTRCSYYYNMEDWVQLQISSSPNGPWSPYTAYVDNGYTYQLDDWTAPECGNHYWRTVAKVSLNGGANWTSYLFSYVGHWNATCN